MVKSSSSDEPELKERVIHTRVPERLEAELRKRANDLGVSVSNLVRNVLDHAFGLVGDVVADSQAIARAVGGAKVTAAAQAALDDILAWQPMVLGKNAVCARCNEILAKGTEAAMGVAEHGNARAVICTTCFEEIRK